MAQKNKNLFCKYVFKFNFAPITGSDFFYFLFKTQNCWTLLDRHFGTLDMFSPTLPPFTHMYFEEPSRLKCTHEETGQHRLAPSPRCIIPYFLYPWSHPSQPTILPVSLSEVEAWQRIRYLAFLLLLLLWKKIVHSKISSYSFHVVFMLLHILQAWSFSAWSSQRPTLR